MSALAILAGWTLLHLELRARGLEARLVIQRSELDFDDPVDGDFTATSRMPERAEWERFLAMLQRRGRARVRVGGTIASASGTGGTFEGTYVAVRLASSGEG